ncbi:hypothetical protein Sjap_016115 [Stephania japonica]|uniref:Uncharacterized protein n=1 Tax=Stephania japonica TaxID=461633 RepID=A0AAP0ILK0_9MAGN
MDKKPCNSQESEVRKGPWTMEEDLILINYIANHGEGVWNSLARSAGLKRTGKSCRLRWLNYLRPDVRRGNITPEEQLLIMQLHARWGNRYSFSEHHDSSDNQQYHDHGASSSHTSAGIDEGVKHCYSPLKINIAHTDYYNNNNNNPHEAYNPSSSSGPLPPESSTHHDNFWSIEDLWSMQLFNGD